MPKAKATGKKSTGVTGITKRRGGPRAPEFSDFLTKARKEHCAEVGCSTAAMYLINDLLSKFIDRVIDKTGALARYDRKNTMKVKHAATATKMILIGPMSSHASEFADAATSKFLGKPVEV